MLGHIDLFTGIGGFTLACKWAGIETEVFCENDKRCQEFLQRTYPGVPIVPDVREFDGTRWRGRFLLTAGVPCQPASRAGKQRGKDDVRWLWPEAIRVIGEAKPSWCLLENPPGIGDVGLKGILADLEAQGYEVRVFGIPTCAVNSPQLRNRYWIVAKSVQVGREANKRPSGRWGDISTKMHGRGETGNQLFSLEGSSQSDMADTGEQRGRPRGAESKGFERQDEATELNCDMADTDQVRRRRGSGEPGPAGWGESEDRNFWSNCIWLSCADGKVRRAPDDTFGLVNGLHRSVLGALGNSIVPQVAYEIIRSIVEASSK